MCARFVRTFFHGGRVVAAALVLALGAGTAACAKRSAPAKTAADDAGHPLTGVVLSVSAERGTLLVDHDEVPGVMAAMTMEFTVAPGDLAVAREGLRIRARMYQSPDGFSLEQVWPADAVNERIVESAAGALRRDTVERGRGAFREVGERLPDFALYDQTGAVAQAARFRGKQLVVNFIFTRCPDADMCPASTMKMTQLQAEARALSVANLELISITLDPEYDTPGILRDYAEARGIDTTNFSFLTGPEGAIKDLLTQLGVIAFNDGPLLKHSLATVLVDDTGRIVHRMDGSGWKPADFASRLRRPTP